MFDHIQNTNKNFKVLNIVTIAEHYEDVVYLVHFHIKWLPFHYYKACKKFLTFEKWLKCMCPRKQKINLQNHILNVPAFYIAKL
jgi:hypothetical protein